MRQSLINSVFGTIFIAGLTFVVVLSLFSTLPGTATEGVSTIHNVISPSSSEVKSDKYPLTFIPPIGLGTWLSKPGEVAAVVKYAIDIGYRHIDTAKAYGNEKEVGEGIKKSGVPRSEIWVTSKLFNDDHDPDDVEPAIRKTLSDLDLDYLDLYLIHWPVAVYNNTVDKSITYVDTWKALEKVVQKGLTKNIGISNFAQHEVATLLEHATIRPTFHEFETHPYLQQTDFVAWNLAQGIQVIAYSPFANLNPVYDSGRIPSILDDEFWTSLASSKNATVPQTILAWGQQRGTTVIPKSVHESRILENYASKDIRFTDQELRDVEKTNKKLRLNNPGKNWEGSDLFSDLEGYTPKGKQEGNGGVGDL